jgi:hypothetical protein
MNNLLNAQTLPMEDSKETDWCKVLWVAVLERAIHDAFYQNDYKEAKEALDWLNPKNLDFQLICEFAGTNADFIIRKLFIKIKARQKFFRTIREGSNFWEAQKKFEKDMKWNPNLPKRI